MAEGVSVKVETKKKTKSKSRKKNNNTVCMDALQISLARKKECEAKALQIVTSLLENSHKEHEVLEQCMDINKSYYDDLVEERAIASLCGYPICCNHLKKLNSSQQYHISLRNNKVFDIKDRKRFCSSLCFKASQFLENQLPSCPVWLLDEERPQKLELYRQDIKSHGLGNEIVFEDQKLKEELIKCSVEFAKTANDDLSQAINRLKVNNEIVDIVEETQTPSMKKNSSSDAETAEINQNRVKNKSISNIKQDKSLTQLKTIEKSLQQWITSDTLKYLLGPEKYANALSSSGESSLVLNELQAKETLEKNYAELCRKLDVEEIVDNVMDSQLVHETHETSWKKETLPSFESLAKESEQFSINVRAFYQGQMEVLTDAASEKGKVPLNKISTESELVEDDPVSQNYSLPLVDSQSQAALRRQIVLNKLNRVNYAIFQMLELKPRDIVTELRQLVATFDLQADNINFRPAEWTLVLIIILHLLAFKMDRIRQSLQNEASQKLLTTLMLPFSKPATYFTHLTNNLMDVNNLTKRNLSS